MKIIKSYNNLVSTMNDLSDEGYNIYNFCDYCSGYGFYLEFDRKHYIECRVCENTYHLSLKKHNSRFHFDILNDILIANHIIKVEDYRLVKKEIIKLIKSIKGE